jgi:FtsP/CotA-like multicopper oxidase with cupredoxin domain
MIDGRVFDDDTEEWTILNTDQQYHSFHLHQTPFLVTEVNGMPQDEDSLRDTASIPPATGAGARCAEGGHAIHRSGDRRAALSIIVTRSTTRTRA